MTEISLDFKDPLGGAHTAIIIRNESNPDNWEITVDGQPIAKEKKRDLEEIWFCERDDNGDVPIGKEMYSCHKVVAASEGALLIGNLSCPYFLNPPGIWIDL